MQDRKIHWARAASWIIALGGVALLLAGRPGPSQTFCTGDCNGDGEVTIDEILVMVNIALGSIDLSECPAADPDGSGDVTIDEILQAVNNAQTGCPEIAPTPTPTPVSGELGSKRFLMSPQHSRFRAGIAPGFVVAVGMFRGQTDGVVGDAYLDLVAGEPDEAGIAFIDVVGAPDYIFADGGGLAPLVLCLRPILPAVRAGTIDCNGTLDFSILTSIDHRLGEIGVDDFTAEDCAAANGTLEGPNQICAAGDVGAECYADADCDTQPAAGDGACGITDATCTAGNVGAPCRNGSDCESAPGADDGECGPFGFHPGVCNGPLQFGVAGETNRPGETVIAPVPEFGLGGLPVELTIESAAPCGDEGPGLQTPFAMTTALSRTSILNFNNDNVDFPFLQRGRNFSCQDWRNSSGQFVLSFATLHQLMGGDVITGFEFGSVP